MLIPFGEYTPDIHPLSNNGLTVATNCLPFGNYYSAVKGLSPYSLNSLGRYCRGFISVRDKSNTVYIYAGDESNLYRCSGSTFINANTSASASVVYSTAATDNWEMVQWGESVVATNYADNVQIITLGGSNFATLSGSPPKSRHLGVVRDFLVLGNVTDYSSGAACSNRVHWSGFNNIETWSPSQSTQADYQDLMGDGGWIQRVIGGERGVIFQERSNWLMTYVGAPTIFQFDEIEPGKGTPCPGSVASMGNSVFYLGNDDFYVFQGGHSTPIAKDKIYKTFISDLQTGYLYRMKAEVDPYNTIVYWLYPGEGSVAGFPNKILAYNWSVNKWSGPNLISAQNICITRSEGYTLDSLDALCGSNISALAYSLDAREYMGGIINLGAFNSSNRLCTFQGDYLDAVLETGEKQIRPGRKSLIVNTRPMIEAESASISLAVGGRNSNESVSYGTPVVVNSEGEAPVENESRYHRFKTTISGGFEKAIGIEVESEPGGRY